MRRLSFLLCLMLLFSMLYADELDDKMKQLKRVQSELETAEKKAAQTASQKKQNESEIKRTSSLKRITDQNVNKYRKQERVLRDSLSQVEHRLQITEERLDSYNTAQNRQLEILMRVDRSYKPKGIAHRDHRYLGSLARQNRQSISALQGTHRILRINKDNTSREANLTSRSLRSESRKSSEYNRKITNLNKETSKLSSQEKTLQNQIAQLKKDASALEGLITRLMQESGKKPASYQFTQIKISWPVRGKIIRSYGQETRSYGTSVVSNGIDIAVKEGTNVIAVDDGEVVFSDRYGGQGKLIIIDHKNGFFSLYAYNSDLLVNSGAKVKRGQTIAKSGSTGSASEASLHFELRKDGKAVNPVPYFE
ncbi:MAG: peptidoglycan DD-metalloendopeptidase family protein [Candidatus Cloacimonetes bacterium]|nr:peptidoglycan DD-metalloendopeptidase family protein [Candidatus Cloacimonadota bacterium]